jgi:hypothetical protein
MVIYTHPIADNLPTKTSIIAKQLQSHTHMCTHTHSLSLLFSADDSGVV